MPELPEVEIVIRGLNKKIISKKIVKAEVFKTKLRREVNKNFINDLINAKIDRIRRRSKYIIVDLSNEKSIIFHLGMTGRLTVEKHKNSKKHNHIILTLDDENCIIYNDVRRFGLALSCNTSEIEKHELIKDIGIEPLDGQFTGKVFYDLLKKVKSNIKISLLNQKLVCGIGNIYACEALFYSGIDPRRSANSLKLKECELLAKTIKKILNDSIEYGGSSFRDYVHSDGSKGSFQDKFTVYGRAGEDCIVCGTKIENIKQSGRSTFYCLKCQK